MSYTGNVVSYQAIVDKQISEFGFEVDDAQAIEWLTEFMAHTKTAMVMRKETRYVLICDGRGDLPFDIYKIVQSVLVDGVNTLEEAACGEGIYTPMRWSTDHFHDRYHKDDRDYTTESAHTYTVDNGFIFPSFSTGVMAIACEIIPTDENGAPLIPGDQSWLEAAAHYLAYKAARKRWFEDTLSDKKFLLIERDKEWYFAQAVNSAKLDQNVDQAESFKNSYIRTIPDLQAHSSMFANFQLPEERQFRDKSSRSFSTPSTVTQSKSNLSSNPRFRDAP